MLYIYYKASNRQDENVNKMQKHRIRNVFNVEKLLLLECCCLTELQTVASCRFSGTEMTTH